MKKIVILGSTGSIGCQAINVIKRLRGEIEIAGLTTYSNLALLKKQIRVCRPQIVSVWKEEQALELNEWCKRNKIKLEILHGLEGLVEIAGCAASDMVLSAVVGSIGLKPLLAAIKSKKNIALANKEALVIAGDIIMAEAKKNKVKLIPVDSEHSAVFQCLKQEDAKTVHKIILTASGGPFYRYNSSHSDIKVSQALDHPTWKMGQKITIDSATLMNKGLEAIEAHHLFNIGFDKIEIVIHPQSIVHSMVEFIDTTVLAHLSYPTMELPIQYALTYPERCKLPLRRLDLSVIKRLEFDAPDFDRFPCLKLALNAGKISGTMPAVMNAANEKAVRFFLDGKIKFTDIAKIIKKVMSLHKTIENPSLDDIFAADLWAREVTRAFSG
ncbi:MAG: 1-deoxy-D-xylulose-5-phosphate reductoisomerase [Elusimicrobia bacterium]|nr:1-deoxy-D-xylulose-5-phosphate reductoisomerase [Candidatus Liberimonas magnetica]